MNTLIYTVIWLIVFVSSGIVGLYLLFLISLVGGHNLPTSKRATEAIHKIISEYKPDAKNFYDLGCARGNFAIAIKKKFPQFSCTGIDKNILRIFFAKLRSIFFGQQLTFKKEDLLKTNLRNADIVYLYVWYTLMPPLEKKLQKELQQGAIVITNTINFPDWQPTKTYIVHPKHPNFEKLFVYIK